MSARLGFVICGQICCWLGIAFTPLVDFLPDTQGLAFGDIFYDQGWTIVILGPAEAFVIGYRVARPYWRQKTWGFCLQT